MQRARVFTFAEGVCLGLQDPNLRRGISNRDSGRWMDVVTEVKREMSGRFDESPDLAASQGDDLASNIAKARSQGIHLALEP